MILSCASQAQVPRIAAREVYNRHKWGGWDDSNHDCLNTRNEVLKKESLIPVVQKKCKIVSGRWVDFYSGEALGSPREIDIDHVVPIKHAFSNGAATWTRQQRETFYNDTDNLVVTSRHNNRQKGASDFTNWMPSERRHACKYAERWMKVKTKYDLEVSKEENQNYQLLNCDG